MFSATYTSFILVNNFDRWSNDIHSCNYTEVLELQILK